MKYSGIPIKRAPLGNENECPLYGDVPFIGIPYKNEYLAKINQEWVFEVNEFHRVKKGHDDWNGKCVCFKITSQMLLLQKKNLKSITLVF